jgi:hypothetical protein
MKVFVAAGAIEFGQPFSGMCLCQSYHSYERCYVQHASPAAFGVQNDAHTCGSDNPQTLVDDEVSWWHLVQEGSIVHVCDIAVEQVHTSDRAFASHRKAFQTLCGS